MKKNILLTTIGLVFVLNGPNASALDYGESTPLAPSLIPPVSYPDPQSAGLNPEPAYLGAIPVFPSAQMQSPLDRDGVPRHGGGRFSDYDRGHADRTGSDCGDNGLRYTMSQRGRSAPDPVSIALMVAGLVALPFIRRIRNALN